MKISISILVLIFCQLTFGQKKCRYDYEKYDDMLKKSIVKNELKVKGGIGQKWWYTIQKVDASIYLRMRLRTGSLEGLVVGKDDPLMIKFENSDNNISINTDKIYSSYVFSIGNISVDEIEVVYTLTSEIAERLNLEKIEKIRFYYNDVYRECEFSSKEADKFLEKMSCIINYEPKK